MSPHVPEKTGTGHTDKQWKVEGGGREGKQRDRKKTTRHSTQNASSCFTNKINKLYNPKHDESYTCASITRPLTTIIGHSHSWSSTQLNFF